MGRIVIGTRGSALALAQTELVKARLAATLPGITIDVSVIKTEGDRKQGTSLASQSDKRDWVIDLERALIARQIDLAVHCGKDVPGELEPGTEIRAILNRASPFDAFIGKLLPSGQRISFANLPSGALIGTASLRRKAALRSFRNDLQLRDHRGNVPTRIKKLDESLDLDGIVVAAAGLERLSLTDLAYEVLDRQIMLPAMNQGILAAQVRTGDTRIAQALSLISDEPTIAAFTAERAVATVLGGDCHSAISIFAEITANTLTIECRVFSEEGTHSISSSISGPVARAIELGTQLGHEILSRGGAEILGQINPRAS